MAPFLITYKKNLVAFFIFLGQAATLKLTYRTTRRTLSQLKKYNFSGERKNHWPGQCNHIKRTTLLPPCGHFRK
jgi:hypothetical protein